MATTLQLNRGTAAQAAAYVGAEGELFVDVENKMVYLHDGVTVGGNLTGGGGGTEGLTTKEILELTPKFDRKTSADAGGPTTIRLRDYPVIDSAGNFAIGESYFGSYAGRIIAFNADGSYKYTISSVDGATSKYFGQVNQLDEANDTLYTKSNNGKIYKFTWSTGAYLGVAADVGDGAGAERFLVTDQYIYAINNGVVHKFDKSTGAQLAVLTPSTADTSFGYGMAEISGGRIALGSHLETVSGVYKGKVYVFDMTTDTELFFFTHPNAQTPGNEGFGVKLIASTDKNTLFIASPTDSSATATLCGSVIAMDVSTNSPTFLWKVLSPDNAAYAYFGNGMAYDGTFIFAASNGARKVTLINAADGSVLTRFTGSQIVNQPGYYGIETNGTTVVFGDGTSPGAANLVNYGYVLKLDATIPFDITSTFTISSATVAVPMPYTSITVDPNVVVNSYVENSAIVPSIAAACELIQTYPTGLADVHVNLPSGGGTYPFLGGLEGIQYTVWFNFRNFDVITGYPEFRNCREIQITGGYWEQAFEAYNCKIVLSWTNNVVIGYNDVYGNLYVERCHITGWGLNIWRGELYAYRDCKVDFTDYGSVQLGDTGFNRSGQIRIWGNSRVAVKDVYLKGTNIYNGIQSGDGGQFICSKGWYWSTGVTGSNNPFETYGGHIELPVNSISNISFPMNNSSNSGSRVFNSLDDCWYDNVSESIKMGSSTCVNLERAVKLNVRTTAPTAPTEGMIAICDGVGWNAMGDGLKHVVCYLNGAWVQLV